MNLKRIRQNKDKYFTRYIFKQIEQIKKCLNIPFNARIFYLGYSFHFDKFLYENKVIYSACDCEKDKNNKYLVDKVFITDLYEITMLKEYPKTNDDIIFKIIKQSDKFPYTGEMFLNWINFPSAINIEVDLPYFKIIKFLQTYRQSTFKTKDYVFYSKRDDEYCYTLNIYAKDLKNNAELKLYMPDKYIRNLDTSCELSSPQSTKDFFAIDLSGKLSKYQIRKCKKAFCEFANEYCLELKTKNFYALELVKQTIQPVEQDYGWSVHRVFSGNFKFSNIWISDIMLENEEPYFMVTDNSYSWETTKLASLNMKNAKYHTKEIYKQDLVKFQKWKLNKQYIKDLMIFLKEPVSAEEFEYYTENYKKIFKKYIKNNWQKLIFEYNRNTACWGWDEKDFENPPKLNSKNEFGIEQLPFDLPMPDYTELFEDA